MLTPQGNKRIMHGAIESVISPKRHQVIKNLRSRLQLKEMLQHKLISKYGKNDYFAVEGFISEQLDQLFQGPPFDERDLVAVDRRVQTFSKACGSKKLEQLQLDRNARPVNSVTSARLKDNENFFSPRQSAQNTKVLSSLGKSVEKPLSDQRTQSVA